MIKNPCISGIYGILPSALVNDLLLQKAEATMRGGVQVLQYRNKKLGFQRARKQCLALRALCDDYHCALVINDSIQLAKHCKADGVHLGREDVTDLTQARRDIGRSVWMGITCRGDAALAQHALSSGADYVSFGAVFATTSKTNVPVIGMPRLQKARDLFPHVTLCAIGGIDATRIPQLKACGVDAVAVISSLFSATDLEKQARLLVTTWEDSPCQRS